ncbi:MAG: hypothetical protein AAFR69_10200, partial [Pseudomonadota bacterium]
GTVRCAAPASSARAMAPDLATQTWQMIEHYRATLALYGDPLGIRMARKHLAAFIDQLTAGLEPAAQKALRQQLCTSASPKSVIAALEALGMRAEAGAAGHDAPRCAVPA